MTLRMLFPSCMRWKASLIWSRGIVWVMNGSIWISPFIARSTMPGISVRPRTPPNAEPRHTRPVTSWKGRVAISSPAPATPMMTDSPHPLWQLSSAARIRPTLPTHSKV